MEENKILKKVFDMGSSAYLMMHGFKVKLRDNREKAFIFEINAKDSDDFEEKQDDYLNSEFHRFDACLMSLKKRWKPYE